MRIQLVIAIALSSGLSVAHAQAPNAESQPKAAAHATQAKAAAPGAQPKAAASDAQSAALSPAAAKNSPAPTLDAQAEYDADVQLVTARAFLVNENLPAAAIEPLTNFLALHPQHFQARLMRAYSYGRVGRYEEAEADYHAALDVMTGTSADEVLLRAQEFAFTKQREIALTLIDDGIRRLGPIPTLEAAALRYELALHRTAAAVARIEFMLSRTRRKEALYIKLGDILEEAGFPDKATEARRQALAAIDKLPESEKVGKIKRQRDDLVYRLNRAARSSSW
jgi:tetratricopeptide (TPR) repeat protein